MPTAIVAGSFNPPTVAHLDLIQRAHDLFGNVTVLFAINPDKVKKSSFVQVRDGEWVQKKNPLEPPVEDCVRALRECFPKDDPTYKVEIWDGLIAQFYTDGNPKVLVRGLRTVSDFEQEMIQAHVNSNLGLPTIWLPTTTQNSYVSSSVVRQLIKFQAYDEAAKYLPTPIAQLYGITKHPGEL